MNNESLNKGTKNCKSLLHEPQKKKKKKNIQIRQHNKTKLKHNCKPSQEVKIV